MKVYLGLDPGHNGSICFLYEDNTVKFLDNSLPLSILIEGIKSMICTHTVQMCMIEDVHSIYGSSAKSNFTFGFNTGLLHGIISTLGLPLDQVQPKVWQKHIGVKSTVKGKFVKLAVAEIMQKVYPSITFDIYTPRSRLRDGRSDAIGIASYCKFKHT